MSAFSGGVNDLVSTMMSNLKSFYDSTRGKPDHQPQKIVTPCTAGSDGSTTEEQAVQSGRNDSDRFFDNGKTSNSRDQFEDDYKKAMLSGNDAEVLKQQKRLHFTKTLEQEYNMRYNCSRRHGIRTASNNSERISRDFPTLFNLG